MLAKRPSTAKSTISPGMHLAVVQAWVSHRGMPMSVPIMWLGQISQKYGVSKTFRFGQEWLAGVRSTTDGAKPRSMTLH